MNKEQKAQSIIGPLGAIISHSKSGYIERHPENLPIFNANICTKDGKIWWGDLDVTLKQTFIADLAFILKEDLYVQTEKVQEVTDKYVDLKTHFKELVVKHHVFDDTYESPIELAGDND